MTELTSKDEVRRLSTRKKRRKFPAKNNDRLYTNSIDRLQKPYVRTQLAIVTAGLNYISASFLPQKFKN